MDEAERLTSVRDGDAPKDIDAANVDPTFDEASQQGDEDTASELASSASQPWNLQLSIHALSTITDDAVVERGLNDDDGVGNDTDNVTRSEEASLSKTKPSDQASDRAELLRRLKRIFDLDDTEELVSSHPCWLFRSIVLQGYLYILTSHLCFYAYLPSRQDKTLRAGPLRKRTQRTFRFSRHWAILRGRALSWYESERSPYFPQDQIDLRDVFDVGKMSSGTSDAVATEAPSSSSQAQRFFLRTPYRTFTFETDSEASCDAWIESITTAAFRAQNEGESVRITIPLESILDIDSSNANPLAGHTSKAQHGRGIQDVAVVTIKVIQSILGDAELTMDEYFFTNMADEALFMDTLRSKLASYAQSQAVLHGSIRESIGTAATTSTRPIDIRRRKESLNSGKMTPTTPRLTRPATLAQMEAQLADAAASDSPLPVPGTPPNLSTSVRTLRSSADLHGYPPSSPEGASASSAAGDRRWAIPQWLRDAPLRLANNTSDNLNALANRLPHRSVRELWSANLAADDGHSVSAVATRRRYPSSQQGSEEVTGEEDLESSIHSAYSILEVQDAEEEANVKEQDILEQFRRCFALPDTERLLYHTSASLYRILPVYGRLFVSARYVCFRSSSLASKTIGRTLMILPRSEVISVARNNAVQYGRHGLVIIVRGHEELFFEFTSTQRRDQCISILQSIVDGDDDDHDNQKDPPTSGEDYEPFLLTDLGGRGGDAHSDTSSPHPSASASSLFASSLSSFMPVKPRDDLHFTFLTVGSRGDVQPYIALARGLMREGHRVRIATHLEFGKWIESFGIEFQEVGGDPAELMRICVENGTFTLAFVRESVTKFRGWLDDLLLSCWHACQGTDVIIESPSAIAGIHIAEALGVPYYRAFTMPWTRTRAYPHAFAVPSRRAGGNYNYMSYVIFDQVFWRASSGQINAWRDRCLHLPPTSFDLLEQHKVPFLYNFSPNLVPKPLDWSDWIHVTGFWFLDNSDETGASKAWTPPVELVDFISRARLQQRKLVYIGWGSIVIPDADAVLQVVVEAIRMSGVCAILSRGWSDRLQDHQASSSEQVDNTIGSAVSAVWDDIFTVQSVPHDWLFPQMDVACHHGGSGTLGASLRAGVPTIVRPFFGDQFFWASQVENLQIGTCVAHPFTADRFAAALKLCATDARMSRNARAMADAIAKEDGVGSAVRAIYADWEYACSRIKLTESQRGRRHAERDEEAPIAVAAHSEDVEDDGRSMDGWSVVSGSEEGIEATAKVT